LGMNQICFDEVNERIEKVIRNSRLTTG